MVGRLRVTKMSLWAMGDKAVTSGKVSAAEVAQKVVDAVLAGQFYIYSHPRAIGLVGTRLEDVLQGRINDQDVMDQLVLNQYAQFLTG